MVSILNFNIDKYRTLEVKYVGERDGGNIFSYGELCKYRDQYIISCPRCGGLARLQTKKKKLVKYHKIISLNPVTVENSVICPYCYGHYYIRKGKVVVI